MPGTVATTQTAGDVSSKLDLPVLMIQATLTTGRASAASTTTRIGQSDSVPIPKGTRELVLHYKITDAQTDSGDTTFALVELNYQGTWVPALSTATILGNATEPIVKGAALQPTTGGGVWTNDSTTAAAASASDGKQIPAGASAARIAFYVTADADGVQDDSFTGSAELWAI